MVSEEKQKKLGTIFTWIGVALTANLLVLWLVETITALSHSPGYRGEYLVQAERAGLSFVIVASICLGTMALIAGLAFGGRRKVGVVAVAVLVLWIAHRIVLYVMPFPMQPPHEKPWDEYEQLDMEELEL